MTTPNKYEPQSNTEPMPLPCCPYCAAEIPGLALFHWQCGPWVIMCCYCPNQECRKCLTFQVVPVGVAGEESRIQVPS